MISQHEPAEPLPGGRPPRRHRAAVPILLAAAVVFLVAVWIRFGGSSNDGNPQQQYPTAGRMPEGFDADSSPEAIAFKTTCSRCHALPSPLMRDADGWKALTPKMHTHMIERGWSVPRGQVDQAAAYLIRHARQTARPNGPRRLPASPTGSRAAN
jgi:hypothetical protein